MLHATTMHLALANFGRTKQEPFDDERNSPILLDFGDIGVTLRTKAMDIVKDFRPSRIKECKRKVARKGIIVAKKDCDFPLDRRCDVDAPQPGSQPNGYKPIHKSHISSVSNERTIGLKTILTVPAPSKQESKEIGHQDITNMTLMVSKDNEELAVDTSKTKAGGGKTESPNSKISHAFSSGVLRSKWLKLKLWNKVKSKSSNSRLESTPTPSILVNGVEQKDVPDGAAICNGTFTPQPDTDDNRRKKSADELKERLSGGVGVVGVVGDSGRGSSSNVSSSGSVDKDLHPRGVEASGQTPTDMSLLQLLALNALDLTAPAVLLNKKKGWMQLSGHPNSFAPAGPGTIWKKALTLDNTENEVYRTLMNDPSRKIVPKYHREVVYQGEKFLEIEDLLYEFDDPFIMDIKMGTRTFLESEVQNCKARSDLYEKMIKVDKCAPTEEEHRNRSVTKLRYMQFREEQSSSCSLGFRIEAIKLREHKEPITDLKKVKTREEVKDLFSLFLQRRQFVHRNLLLRLEEIKELFQLSPFFRHHEVIGSSILVIFDDNKVGAWLIDFAKTCKVPDEIDTINHRSRWALGNHEEGYLFGLDNLIEILGEVDLSKDCSGLLTPADAVS